MEHKTRTPISIPSLCLLACSLITLLFADAGSASPLAPQCLYGTLPGIFEADPPPGSRWQLLSQRCPLQNHLEPIRQSAETVVQLPSSILFLSDSMDFQLLVALCTMVNGTIGSLKKHHAYNTCKVGDTILPIGQVYLPTLTPLEMVQLPSNYQQGHGTSDELAGYKAKMALARGNWSADHPGLEPTLVVMGGGLWDIFRWLTSTKLADTETQVRVDKKLDAALLQWWIGCAREAIQHARELFPASHLVWRNYALPSWNMQSGATLNTHLGMKGFVVQMKAAGWQAGLEEGLELLDVAAVVEEFPSAESYLLDRHHPATFISQEVLNVLFNIARRQDEQARR